MTYFEGILKACVEGGAGGEEAGPVLGVLLTLLQKGAGDDLTHRG